MASRRAIWKVGAIVSVGAAAAYTLSNNDLATLGVMRVGRTAVAIGSIMLDYKRTIYANHGLEVTSPEYIEMRSQVHQRSAEKLLDLCSANGGVFIKVGQHIGALEYLLPTEYVETMKVLHSKAPKSSLEEVHSVFRSEFKKEISEMFASFSEEPVGAASLAQVHKATTLDGQTCAVKVQHPHVKARSHLDMRIMDIAVRVVARVFPDFQLAWLAEITKKNLPVELDFANEGKNLEKSASLFSKFSWLKIPSVDWKLTSSKVLTMSFEEGAEITDVDFIHREKIDPEGVTAKLGELYSEMIFEVGFVHCDPHPGNVLVRKNGGGETELVLLDHGLYTTLKDTFRVDYSRLWMSIIDRDVSAMEALGRKIGVGDLHMMFICIVTGRSWESVKKGVANVEMSLAEQFEYRDSAVKYIPEIAAILARVPPDMIMIFKTNDLLRAIERKLGTTHRMESFLTMAECCIRSLYKQDYQDCSSIRCRTSITVGRNWELFKIKLYRFYLWFRSLWQQVRSESHIMSPSLGTAAA